MDNLDILEAARGGPFRIKHGEQTLTLPSPDLYHYQTLLGILQDRRIPGLPYPMAEWKQSLVFERWSARHGLPTFLDAQRLAYLLDRYRRPLTYDLQVHCQVDLGDLWRLRHWSLLLDLIDHLPGHSWYATAVTSDEEHAEMLAKSLADRAEAEGDTPSSAGPALHTWTPEVSEVRALRDDVRHLTYVLAAVNGDKSAKPPAPLPRPSSPLAAAMARAKHRQRQAKHEALVARLLPHKGQS